MPTFVQSRTTTGVTTPLALAYTSNNGGGNLLVAYASTTAPIDDNLSVSDSNGNTWVAIPSTVQTTTMNHRLFYAANCAAGANTVTLTSNQNASGNNLVIAEYSGIATVSPLDPTAGNTKLENVGTTTPNSNTITTTANGNLVVGGWSVIDHDAGIVVTAGTNLAFTLRQDAGGDFRYGFEDAIQATAGVVDAEFTLNNSERWICNVAAFKAAIPPLDEGLWNAPILQPQEFLVSIW